MSKKKTQIWLAVAVIVVLVFLALVLQGQAKGVVLGMIFILVFVGTFGGLIFLLNFLNERYLVQPRHPTHLCHYCYSLYQNPEEMTCEYCVSEFGLQKELYPLNEFLQANTVEDLQNRQMELEKNLKSARGRNILFIEHDLKRLRRMIKMKE